MLWRPNDIFEAKNKDNVVVGCIGSLEIEDFIELLIVWPVENPVIRRDLNTSSTENCHQHEYEEAGEYGTPILGEPFEQQYFGQ